MQHVIRLKELVCEGNRLTFNFSTSLDLFHRKSFFIEYDKPIETPLESINSIPFAAVMAPISWATGAELVIPVLDEEYVMSLERCSRYFKKWFSKKWSFESSIEAFQVRNPQHPTRYAMLFSGGLDSLATYICHKEKNPLLFTIFGADIPLSHKIFVDMCREKFNDFAKRENASIQYIGTDARDILRLDRLQAYSKNWYGEVAHGLMMSSMIAPVAYKSVQTLMIASCSHRPGSRYPCGSEKELVQEIRWAGTGIENDNHELSRCDKIRNFFKPNTRFHSYLRVCWMQFKSLNCSKCEKCLRTICELLINNVDPAKCNFTIDHTTLPLLKKRILSQYYMFFRGENALDFWRTIQDSIHLDQIEDLYGSREFFQWFGDFHKIRERQNPLLLNFYSWVMKMRNLMSKRLKPVKTFVEKIMETGFIQREFKKAAL